ncbi:hypothetical protein Sphch_2991 [Sphingobium chlorophenolicum L-1]|uniref:Uncharacterized protein n=1 Tax=Sphingobium chlorophenolicum L-1 TaxID=690566 RepID=F6F2F9_SPHCR|nr:hypothetical protein Sphch_2991 [Sphingobium chlorophenolicum L-1]
MGDGKDGENRLTGRIARITGINEAASGDRIAAGAVNGARRSPSGSVTRRRIGLAAARAFNTTLVVAGLKAEPVSLLDGGPKGASALSSATQSDSHRNRMKGRPPGPASFLYGVGVMCDTVPSQRKIGTDAPKNQPRKPSLPVDIGESFQ